MAFEIDKGDTYEWTVALGEPSNRTNKAETFTGRFRRLSQPRIDEINEAIRQRMIASTAGEPVDGMIDDMQLADEIVVGWSGITSNAQPVEFSEGLKQELIARASFAAAVVEAWNESIIGGRKKTSRTPQGNS
jgi:hypothetical protein